MREHVHCQLIGSTEAIASRKLNSKQWRFLSVRRKRSEAEVYFHKVPVAQALNDSCKRYQSSFAGRAIVFGHFSRRSASRKIFLRNERRPESGPMINCSIASKGDESRTPRRTDVGRLQSARESHSNQLPCRGTAATLRQTLRQRGEIINYNRFHQRNGGRRRAAKLQRPKWMRTCVKLLSSLLVI